MSALDWSRFVVMLSLLTLMLFTCAVKANTEKAIFLGPPTVKLPSAHPSLQDLQVRTLTPDNGQIRTHLEARFPSVAYPHGRPIWFMLDDLAEGQRYEVRVCWAATVSRKTLIECQTTATEAYCSPATHRI